MRLRSGTLLSSKSDNQLLSDKKTHSEQLSDECVYDDYYQCIVNTINKMIYELNDYMDYDHKYIVEAAQLTNELYYHMNYYIDIMQRKDVDVEKYRNFAIARKYVYEQLLVMLNIEGNDKKTIQFAIDEMSEFIMRTI